MMNMKPTRHERETLTPNQIEAIERMTENAREVSGTCGHGYVVPACPVHLPHAVLNELERVEPLYRTDEWWKGL